MSAQLLAEPPLATTDPAVAELIEDEIARQSETICLIPSENYVSRAVLEAMGSVFTNKYSRAMRNAATTRASSSSIARTARDRARQSVVRGRACERAAVRARPPTSPSTSPSVSLGTR